MVQEDESNFQRRNGAAWKDNLTGAARRAAKARRHRRAAQRRSLKRARVRNQAVPPISAPRKVNKRNLIRSDIEHSVAGEAHVVFPEEFDLINNYAESVAALDDLRKHTCETPAKTVYVDHSKMLRISPEAVVVLLAEMMRSDNYSPKTLKLCIRPDSAEACEILWKTGYMLHFENQQPSGMTSKKEYVRYVSFNQRKQRQAKKLVDHFKPACGFDVDAAKALKVAIAECMDNVMKHAYQPPKTKQIINRWWMMGHRDQSTHECYFCFYDQGNGIPGTIRVRLGDLLPFAPTDSEMIARGMEGRYSRTKDAGRGTGLPTLMEFINAAEDGQLLILSGKGRYSFRKGKNPEYADNPLNSLEPSSSGTLRHDMSKVVISLKDDYDECPSGREWIKSDPRDASGERFREQVLKPALALNDQILVDLDGADALPPSFLDEAFGKLAEEMGRESFDRRVEINLTDDKVALRKLTEALELRGR